MGNRSQRKKKIGIGTKLICAAIVIVALGAIGGMYYVNSLGKPLDESNSEVVAVSIPTGSGTGAIGKILQDNNIIASANQFKILSKLEGNDGKYKAGEYSLSPVMSSKEIMEIIISGDSITETFTVQEGLTLQQAVDKLSAENLVNKETFMSEVQYGTFDYKFMPLLPNSENRLEGFLYPETYEIYSNASEHDIINKMLSQFDKLVTEEYYTRAEELGYDMYEIVIIASLIERETRVSDERPTVASVIYNRLAIGQPLQIDAAIQYALPEHKERLTNKDLKVDSPYNTYENAGIPPGPICSPSVDSIKAALYPADTNYYYYVLKPDNTGAHNFSNTYAEFLKNKSAYKNSL